jgi:hypothetical protein
MRYHAKVHVGRKIITVKDTILIDWRTYVPLVVVVTRVEITEDAPVEDKNYQSYN